MNITEKIKQLPFKIKINKYGFFAILCAAVWLGGITFPKTLFLQNKPLWAAIIIFCYFAVTALFVYKRRNALTLRHWAGIIFTGAFLIRVIYIWSTTCSFCPHDMLSEADENGIMGGHLGYIIYLLNEGRLPDFDPTTVLGFYNPPLFYIIGAIWYKINLILGVEWLAAAEQLRILTLLFTSFSVLVMKDIIDQFDIGKRVKAILYVFIAFFPAMIWLSGNLTTDSLTLLFMSLSFLYTIRWYKTRSTKTIVLLALSIGLGMLTKLNCALMAFGTAFMFALVFVQILKKDKKELSPFLKQILLFAAICVPLGLAWVIRCKVLFDMPVNYIPSMGDSTGQFIENATLWQRLGLPMPSLLSYARTKFETSLDYNIWLTLIRSSLYDELFVIDLTTPMLEKIGIVLLWLSIFTALFMNGCYIYSLFKCKKHFKPEYKWFTLITYAVIIASFISFCFSYPQVCTMNFRYIAVLLVIPCIGTGILLTEKPNIKGLFLGFSCAVAAISIVSNLLYLNYCVNL